MKKLIKKLSAYFIAGVFALSPILMLIMYVTYTEQIICPILLMLLVVSAYIVYVMED